MYRKSLDITQKRVYPSIGRNILSTCRNILIRRSHSIRHRASRNLLSSGVVSRNNHGEECLFFHLLLGKVSRQCGTIEHSIRSPERTMTSACSRARVPFTTRFVRIYQREKKILKAAVRLN